LVFVFSFFSLFCFVFLGLHALGLLGEGVNRLGLGVVGTHPRVRGGVPEVVLNAQVRLAVEHEGHVHIGLARRGLARLSRRRSLVGLARRRPLEGAGLASSRLLLSCLDLGGLVGLAGRRRLGSAGLACRRLLLLAQVGELAALGGCRGCRGHRGGLNSLLWRGRVHLEGLIGLQDLGVLGHEAIAELARRLEHGGHHDGHGARELLAPRGQGDGVVRLNGGLQDAADVLRGLDPPGGLLGRGVRVNLLLRLGGLRGLCAQASDLGPHGLHLRLEALRQLHQVRDGGHCSV